MEKREFRTNDMAPVSGNYQFVGHEIEKGDCVPRLRAYLHLMKGMKLPLHDQCQEPSIYVLTTVTEEEDEPKIQGM
jgi:hypothetical protein